MMKQIIEYGKRNICEIILGAILILCVGAYVIATFYGLPSDDDFANAYTVKNMVSQNGYLFGAIKCTMQTYMQWQGTYFGEFLTYFLSPMNRWGVLGCQIEYALNIVIFFGSLAYLLYQLYMYVFRYLERRIYLVLLTIFVIYAITFMDVSQMFYWHTGLCVYTFPLASALLCFALALSYFRNKNTRKIVFAGIFAFIAAGGALQISAFLCAILLGIVIYRFVLYKKLGKVVVVFGVAFTGSLINALAPGNFARKDAINGGFTLFDAIFDSVKSVLLVAYKDFSSRLLIVVVLVLFFIGLHIFRGYDFEFRYPVLVTIYAFLTVVITDFPVKFGYAGESFPGRCVFVEKMAFAICLFGVVLYWAGWLSSKVDLYFSVESKICIGLCIFTIALPLLQYDVIREMKPVDIYYNWIDGSLRQYEELGKMLFETIESSEDKDVIVTQVLDDMEIFCDIDITEDTTYWVNEAFANYYDKNSVRLVVEE